MEGIYQIKNKINGHLYLGSSCDMPRRWQQHRNSLNGNRHDNRYLQNAWNKYGEKVFVLDVILEMPQSTLGERFEKEQEYLDSKKYQYNIKKQASGGNLPGKENPFFDHHHSEESKRRIGSALEGESSWCSKLTEKDVLKIRRKYANSKITQRELAIEFNVHPSTIKCVVKHDTWKHVKGPITKNKANYRRGEKGLKLTRRQVKTIRELFHNKRLSIEEISKKYNIKKQYVSLLLQGKYWKEAGGPIVNNSFICKGGKVHSSKLSKEKVISIRNKFALGKKQTVLGKEFGIDSSVINRIVNGKAWKHVGGPITKNERLKNHEVLEIRNKYKLQNITQSDLAKQYNIERSTISLIVLGKSWKGVAGPIKGTDY